MPVPNADTHTIAQVNRNSPANVRAANTPIRLMTGTLFHKVKFLLVKAFYIVYLVPTNKKGIASTELSRKLGLRQKTCWYFKRKVMQAMKSTDNYPFTGKVDVDEFFVGGVVELILAWKLNKLKKIF